MESVDRRLLASMQEDAALSLQQIADKVHLSPSQCSRRLQRLYQDGYIERQVALVSAEKLGLLVEAYVMVTLNSHARSAASAFHERMTNNRSVMEVCAITGDSDYLLRIVAANLREFSALLSQELLGFGDVASVRSSIVLQTIKRKTDLPV